MKAVQRQLWTRRGGVGNCWTGWDARRAAHWLPSAHGGSSGCCRGGTAAPQYRCAVETAGGGVCGAAAATGWRGAPHGVRLELFGALTLDCLEGPVERPAWRGTRGSMSCGHEKLGCGGRALGGSPSVNLTYSFYLPDHPRLAAMDQAVQTMVGDRWWEEDKKGKSCDQAGSMRRREHRTRRGQACVSDTVMDGAANFAVHRRSGTRYITLSGNLSHYFTPAASAASPKPARKLALAPHFIKLLFSFSGSSSVRLPSPRPSTRFVPSLTLP